jgi:hypothetical protein
LFVEGDRRSVFVLAKLVDAQGGDPVDRLGVEEQEETGCAVRQRARRVVVQQFAK